MPILQIRDISKTLYLRLRHFAEQEHRSLSQQAVALLEKGLGIEGQRTSHGLMQSRSKKFLNGRSGYPSHKTH